MEGIEFDELLRLEQVLFDELTANEQLPAKDLCDWHRDWLGGIYEWAGEYRSVNMSREDFVFAAARLIPGLMADFERDYLSVHTPRCAMNKDELIEAMAICHVEFIIIHPFRDKYRQWNAAFDAGCCAALGKPYITLHDEAIIHPLKEVDAAAMAWARTPEQVVELLTYVITKA